MKKIPENKRFKFLYNHLGHFGLSLEQATFQLAEEHIPTYTGGYWDFYLLSHNDLDIPLMVYSTDKEIRMVNPNNFTDLTTSALAASIGIAIVAYNHLGWHLYQTEREATSEKFFNIYEGLRNWALQEDHPTLSNEEQIAIVRYID